MVRAVNADNDRFGFGNGEIKPATWPFPGHKDFDSFTVAEIGRVTMLVGERSWNMNPEARGTLSVGPPAPEGPRGAFVFADRSGEK